MDDCKDSAQGTLQETPGKMNMQMMPMEMQMNGLRRNGDAIKNY